MPHPPEKTLRLLFPQWQGGNNPPYYLGAKLLEWLAPQPTGPVEEVPVAPPEDLPLAVEQGIVARNELLEQLRQARSRIDKHQPDRLVILGGDCLVDLAPFSYLSERYPGDLALLWIDSHPDIMTPEQFEHAHAMVLANLLGYGDRDFVDTVARPIKAQNVLYVGLNEPTDWEANTIQELGLQTVSSIELAQRGPKPVLEWLDTNGAGKLAIHLDLDVLDPALFRALLFAEPGIPANTFDGIAKGRLTMEQIVRLLKEVSSVIDVVGLGITEHLPWDALALKNMLANLPLLAPPEKRSSTDLTRKRQSTH